MKDTVGTGQKECAGLKGGLLLQVLGTALIAAHAVGQVSVLTQHNDNGRTGQNTSETILNTSNVNVKTFGKLFSLPVSGQVYAQPLYAPGITINGLVHNVLIVATEQDLVYAFDADSPGAPLWTASMVDAAHGAAAGETPVAAVPVTSCKNLVPSIGITSTPVIDLAAGAIYLEAESIAPGSGVVHRLHALDLASGSEKAQSPVVITATVNGIGDGSKNGQLTFDPLHHLNRPGLLLANGSVYIAYASNCDFSPYHGWLFAYDASSLALHSVFVTTPNGGMGGIWMSGEGIAADEGGNIYLSTGNGDFDAANVPATELGDSVLKLGTAGGNLSLIDYLTPSDQGCMDTKDRDLGSGGVVVLPDQPGASPHLLLAGGKEGTVYVINRDQMTNDDSHYQAGAGDDDCKSNDPEILEESKAVSNIFSNPAYWNGELYYWGNADVLRLIPIVDGLPNFPGRVLGVTRVGFPGATPSISANGTTPGTAIVWGIDTSQGSVPGPAILHAIDATNIRVELWSSTQAPNNQDAADNAVKFAVPTVVNGKVYVGANGAVTVYGLRQSPAVLMSPSPSSTLALSSATFAWTSGAGVASYQLWLGTTGIGSSDLYNSGSVTTTTANVSGLPTTGVVIYARLWSRIAGDWRSSDYTFNASGTAVRALLTAPAAGSQLTAPGATFTWTAGVGPTQYELWLGTTGIGSSDLFNSGSLATTSVSVTGLPTNGVTIYARLWSRISNAWQSADSTFAASGTAAQAVLISPVAGSRLTGSSATFAWTAGTGPTQYELWLGTLGVGMSDLYNSGALTANYAGVVGLPVNGVKIYARLWSRISNAWQSTDSIFIASGTASPAALSSPTPGSHLAGPSVPFTWTAGVGPTQYELWLGTTGVGSSDLFNSGGLTATSLSVTALPRDGVKVYARLWSRISNAWQSVDYTFTSAGTASRAVLTSPAPGSHLTGRSVTFTWKPGSGPTKYELWLGTKGIGSSNLYNSGGVTRTSAIVNALPTKGVKIYARLWSRISNVWLSIDYTYTATGTSADIPLSSRAEGGPPTDADNGDSSPR